MLIKKYKYNNENQFKLYEIHKNFIYYKNLMLSKINDLSSIIMYTYYYNVIIVIIINIFTLP